MRIRILSQNSTSVFAQYINSCCYRTFCRLWSKSDNFLCFLFCLQYETL